MADTSKFVGVVFEGDGFCLTVRSADTKEECTSKTLTAWQQEQADWAATPVNDRAADPPMWDVYQRIRPEPTVVHPPNLGAP